MALRVLELLGYDAAVVGSGVEVISALQQQRYDVILMDMRMPELDGIQTTLKIRQMAQTNSKYREIWIIAMTANTMAKDRQRCYDAGMNDYLSKPINRDALARALERCAAMQKCDRELDR